MIHVFLHKVLSRVHVLLLKVLSRVLTSTLTVITVDCVYCECSGRVWFKYYVRIVSACKVAGYFSHLERLIDVQGPSFIVQ